MSFLELIEHSKYFSIKKFLVPIQWKETWKRALNSQMYSIICFKQCILAYGIIWIGNFGGKVVSVLRYLEWFTCLSCQQCRFVHYSSRESEFETLLCLCLFNHYRDFINYVYLWSVTHRRIDYHIEYIVNIIYIIYCNITFFA